VLLTRSTKVRKDIEIDDELGRSGGRRRSGCRFVAAWLDSFDGEDAEHSSESMQRPDGRGVVSLGDATKQRRCWWQSREPLRSDMQGSDGGCGEALEW
jgi:hypothetical protein